jgi:hypothetical protein
MKVHFFGWLVRRGVLIHSGHKEHNCLAGACADVLFGVAPGCPRIGESAGRGPPSTVPHEPTAVAGKHSTGAQPGAC